jgi:hypothetical protein
MWTPWVSGGDSTREGLILDNLTNDTCYKWFLGRCMEAFKIFESKVIHSPP